MYTASPTVTSSLLPRISLRPFLSRFPWSGFTFPIWGIFPFLIFLSQLHPCLWFSITELMQFATGNRIKWAHLLVRSKTAFSHTSQSAIQANCKGSRAWEGGSQRGEWQLNRWGTLTKCLWEALVRSQQFWFHHRKTITAFTLQTQNWLGNVGDTEPEGSYLLFLLNLLFSCSFHWRNSRMRQDCSENGSPTDSKFLLVTSSATTI